MILLNVLGVLGVLNVLNVVNVSERYWSVAYGPLMRALAILVMSQAVPAIH